ncbi:uncharacterized protein LOC129121161 isoform X1 [Agelaius phoeniceus]|uniref:uncharacterized protein LOC129121161 isoform X1 n=2 Tax=Agelaius phoeniceus TaxID=39638 RepID=UPI004054FF6C
MSGALKLSCSSLIFVLSFRCRRMKSRAEPLIPGEGIPPSRKSRLRAAVKAEWARWSTCHLSWPGMPIPGAVAALGTPRNRGGQVSSGHPLESNQDLRYPEEPRSQRLETTAPRHTRSMFQHPRPTEDGFCLLLFQKLSVGASGLEKGKNLYYHRGQFDVSLAERSVVGPALWKKRERVSPQPDQSLCWAGQFRPISGFS